MESIIVDKLGSQCWEAKTVIFFI